MALARPVRELGTRAPWLHEGGVRGIDIARDGNILTIGDGEARRWMLATGEMAMRTERGPREGQAWDAYLFPEHEKFLVLVKLAEDAWAFRTWDLRTGAYVSEVPLDSSALRNHSIIAVDRDGRRALFCTGEERAAPALVSLEDGSFLARLDGGHERGVFLHDGRIITPDIGGEIRVWDAEGKGSRTLVAPRGMPVDVTDQQGPQRVSALFASRTHPYFAVAYDYRFVVFSVDGKELFEKADHWTPASFSPSGERIAVAASGRVSLFDMEGKERGAVSTDATPLDYFALGLDHRVLVGAQGTGEIHARSTSPGVPAPGAGVERKATVLPGEIALLAAAPTGGGITLSCLSGELLQWEPGQSIPSQLPGTGRGSAFVQWLGPDRLLVVSYNVIRIFSPATHELFAEYPAPGDLLSPNGKLGTLASTSGRFLLFETETGVVRSDVILEGIAYEPPQQSGFVISADRFALSNDGSVAFLQRNRLRAWDANGRLLRESNDLERFTPTLPEQAWGYWRALTWTESGEILVSDSLSGVHLFDTRSGAWTTLVAEKDASITAVSPSQRRVAVAHVLPELGEAGTSIYSLDSRSIVFDVPSGGRHARAEFLPDGTIAISSPDRRVVVWESP